MRIKPAIIHRARTNLIRFEMHGAGFVLHMLLPINIVFIAVYVKVFAVPSEFSVSICNIDASVVHIRIYISICVNRPNINSLFTFDSI